VEQVFQNFESFLANRALKFKTKNFFFAKFECGCQDKAEFCADFETVERDVTGLLTKSIAKKWENRRFSFSIPQTCKSVWQMAFLGGFSIVSADLGSA